MLRIAVTEVGYTVMSPNRIGFVLFNDSEAVKKALDADEDDLYLDHR